MSEKDNQVVTLSEGGREVSFKIYQDVYNSVTGKTEKLVRTYFDTFHVKLADYENLQAQLAQTIEQYDCKISNLNVLVRFSDGTMERFSGIERFAMQACSRNVCIESVDFQYDFLFLLPGTQEPKPYKLEIMLISAVEVEDGLERRKANDAERFMATNLGGHTARVDIDYVDLAVARNLESQVNDWFSKLSKSSYGWLPRICGKLSWSVDPVVRMVSIVACGFGGIYFLADNVTNQQSLFKALAVMFVSLPLVIYISSSLSSVLKKRFDRIKPRSLIELSAKDLEKSVELSGGTVQTLIGFISLTIISTVMGIGITYVGQILGFWQG